MARHAAPKMAVATISCGEWEIRGLPDEEVFVLLNLGGSCSAQFRKATRENPSAIKRKAVRHAAGKMAAATNSRGLGGKGFSKEKNPWGSPKPLSCNLGQR